MGCNIMYNNSVTSKHFMEIMRALESQFMLNDFIDK